jgi:hypothetical protein
MPGWLIAVIVIVPLFLIGGTLFSAVPDRIRRSDRKTAESLDQYFMSGKNPFAMPMHDRAFDKPK